MEDTYHGDLSHLHQHRDLGLVSYSGCVETKSQLNTIFVAGRSNDNAPTMLLVLLNAQVPSKPSPSSCPPHEDLVV
jgi:hypothetical protein